MLDFFPLQVLAHQPQLFALQVNIVGAGLDSSAATTTTTNERNDIATKRTRFGDVLQVLVDWKLVPAADISELEENDLTGILLDADRAEDIDDTAPLLRTLRPIARPVSPRYDNGNPKGWQIEMS